MIDQILNSQLQLFVQCSTPPLATYRTSTSCTSHQQVGNKIEHHLSREKKDIKRLHRNPWQGSHSPYGASSTSGWPPPSSSSSSPSSSPTLLAGPCRCHCRCHCHYDGNCHYDCHCKVIAILFSIILVLSLGLPLPLPLYLPSPMFAQGLLEPSNRHTCSNGHLLIQHGENCDQFMINL